MSNTKRTFTVLGLALFAGYGVTTAVSYLISWLLGGAAYVPDNLYVWITALLPLYVAGVPMIVLIARKAPRELPTEQRPLPLPDLLILFVICMGAMYIFNLVGTGINYLISLIKGSSVINPVEQLTQSTSLPLTIAVGCILAPVVEELIFRKLLLDRVRRFGDRTAIVFTAVCFGLFHGNLSQFFYAVAIGLILGYVAVRTGKISYTIALHILINFFGSAVLPTLTSSGITVFAAVAGMLALLFMIGGTVLFFTNKKNIVLKPCVTEPDAPADFKTQYLNIGMLLYILLCIGSMVIVILS